MPHPIAIPLINPNEPEALLAALHVQEGQLVQIGDPLCTLETTKSTADLEADAAGYVIGIRLRPGTTVRAGERLCYLAETADWQLDETHPKVISEAEPIPSDAMPPSGLRITQPALHLARLLGLDLGRLPQGPLVTEQMLRTMTEDLRQSGAFSLPSSPFDATAILVYGGGGHGKTLIDLLRSLGSYRIVGVVDDAPLAGPVMGLPVLGGGEILPELFAQGVRLAANAVGGIGNIDIRIRIFHRLSEAGFACPAVIHPSAVIEPSASLSAGVQVFAHAYVGSQSQIGMGSIINTGAIVSHDCQVGSYSNLSPGAILAGEVRVGDGVLIGMGATINLQVSIGDGARIGNSATVKSDVPEGGLVRAGSLWPV
jgi:acetyltransferase EpsM